MEFMICEYDIYDEQTDEKIGSIESRKRIKIGDFIFLGDESYRVTSEGASYLSGNIYGVLVAESVAKKIENND